MKTGVTRLVVVVAIVARGDQPRAGGAVRRSSSSSASRSSRPRPSSRDRLRGALEHRLRRAPRCLLRDLGRSGRGALLHAADRRRRWRARRRDPRRDDPSRRVGQPFASFSVDPEGLALTRDDTLVITSEGFATRLIDPLGARVRYRRAPRDAPLAHGVPAERRPARAACARTSVSRAPGRRRTAGTSSPAPRAALVQDGPPATVAAGSPARILRYDLRASASSTGSTSTGRIRSPSHQCPRRSSRSTASSSCCR